MTRIAWSVLMAGALTLAGGQAAQAGPPTSHPPHPQHVKTPKTPGPTVTHAKGGPVHGGTPTTSTSHGRSAKAPTTPPGQAKHGTTSTTKVAATSVPPAMPKNPKLVAKLQGLLPAGMTVEQAADGFKNQGQFIAALHVSNNLGIPFEDLKASMVTDGMSLGSSIQALKPTSDATTETERANKQARADLNDDHDEQQ
jgi:hypothetical protein